MNFSASFPFKEVAMCTKITLFPSLKNEENHAVIDGLKALKQKGVTLTIVGDSGILDEFIDLPSIHTDDGIRVSGVRAINRYVEGCLEKMA